MRKFTKKTAKVKPELRDIAAQFRFKHFEKYAPLLTGRKKPKWRYRHPFIFQFVALSLIAGLCLITGVAVYISSVLEDVPTVTKQELASPASSNMYDKDGNLIWSSAHHKREYVKLKDVPETYQKLLIDTEDATFYKDQGFSVNGVVNAVGSYVLSKFDHNIQARGGSSLEQQLIKLSVFSTSSKDRTISRKIKEFFLAQQLDHNYSKNQILEFYINKIFEGEGTYGVQTIARTYFNKNMRDLTISQQAIIAGLGQSPTSYNLYTNPKLVQARRNTVLALGLKHHTITKAQYTQAKNTPVTDGLQPRNWQSNSTNQLVLKNSAFVSSALAQVKALGYDLTRTPLQITTTLDQNVNQVLSQKLNDQQYYQSNSVQAAATIVDPKTGYVLAQFGGRNTTDPYGLNRATITSRSSGSTIKPFVDYGPAFEYFNWTSNRLVDSSNYVYPGTNITAHNDFGVNYGMISLQKALRMSLNTPAIRALAAVGGTRSRTFLNRLGIKLDHDPAGSDALGLNVSTAQLATAFATLANNGYYHPTQYVTSLKFSDESVKKITYKGHQAMKPSTAFILTKILEGVTQQGGTAVTAHINGVAQGVKTGTVGYADSANLPSNAAMDVSVSGYTKSLAISIWNGFDNPMAPNSWINENFAGQARERAYRDIMAALSKGRDSSEWAQPDTVKSLGGSGLDAAYVATDHATTLSLAQPYSSTLDNNLIQRFFTASTQKKTIKASREDKNYQKLPKGYQAGSWKNDLNSKLQDAQNKVDKLKGGVTP